MDRRSIRDPRILEAIEVCRPGSDDVDDPALRELAEAIRANPEVRAAYDRLQALDVVIAAAFANVSTPGGLEQRILDRLAAAGGDRPAPLQGLVAPEALSASAAEPGFPGPETPAPSNAPAGGGARGSRRWAVAFGAVSVAVAVAVACTVFFFSDREPHYTKAEVLEKAIQFFQDERPEPGRTGAPPPDYPPNPAIARVQMVQWRWLSGLLDTRGVAYDLRSPRGVDATLYVLKRRVEGLPAAPARRPHTTGGCAAEAWQQGDLLYVLVVNSGDRRVFQQILDYRSGPLT